MNRNYDKNGEVKADIWKFNKYLGMRFDFTEKGNVKLRLTTMLKGCLMSHQQK